MKKYKLHLKFWVTSSQRANYLLSLQMHLKSYFSDPINIQDIDSRLRIIDSILMSSTSLSETRSTTGHVSPAKFTVIR